MDAIPCPITLAAAAPPEVLARMTALEKGALVNLVPLAWQSKPPCSLPNDPQELADLAGLTEVEWGTCTKRLSRCWTVGDDGRVLFTFLRAEWDRLRGAASKSAEFGRLGAAKRWGGHTPPNGHPNGPLWAGQSPPAAPPKAPHSPPIPRPSSASSPPDPSSEAKARAGMVEADVDRGASSARRAADSRSEPNYATRLRNTEICRKLLESVAWERTVEDEFAADGVTVLRRGGAKVPDKLHRKQLARLLGLETCTPERCHMIVERVKRGEGRDCPAKWIEAGFNDPYELTELDLKEYRQWYATSGYGLQDRVDAVKERRKAGAA